MKYPLLLCILFLLCLAPISALTPLEASSLVAEVSIENTIKFDSTGPRYYVEEATGSLSWFPRDDSLQDVLDLTITPEPTRAPSYYHFVWDKPNTVETIRIDGIVRTRNLIVPVRKKIDFPLENVPPELSKYLGEGEIIKQSREIRELAQELAGDNTDAYEVVFNLADWTTTNIEYSLASLGEPAIQTSPEVLASKWGKCDEITALFISLNRALGIPARFVAGYSYSSSPLFDREWGGHGWAEVWFPDTGWVPYDVTYGEYGYLDSGHIKLKESPDAKETSIDFTARGTEFDMKTEPLEIKVNAKELRAISDQHIDISLSAPVKEVGFGSTILILAEVKNNRDYYISTRLDLAPTSNTNMLSDTYANIFLKPKQKKTVPFLVQIDKDLESGYRYSFPFRIITRLGQEDSIEISVSERGPLYDRTAFNAELATLEKPDTQKNDFVVTCIQEAKAYLGHTVKHLCQLEGKYPSTIKVCRKASCKDHEVSSGEFSLETVAEGANVFTHAYQAKANGESIPFFVTTTAVSPTDMKINITTNVEEITPSDILNVAVYMTHEGSLPKDLDVSFTVHRNTATENLKDLSRPAKLLFNIPGSALRPGTNELEVYVEYEDELGSKLTFEETTTVELVNVGWGDHLVFFIEDLWYTLADLV